MSRVVILSVCVLAFVASLGNAETLFEDDFSGDLSQWNIEGSASIISTDGNPAPCARTVPISYLVSKQTFTYAGRSLTLSADMRDTDSGYGRSTDLELSNSLNTNRSIAFMAVDGDDSLHPHTVLCGITDADGKMKYSEYISLASIPELADPDGNHWHNGKISFRPSGLVDFYLDGSYLWTSTNTVANFGASSVRVGGWTMLYDNILVTPEPAALSLLAVGGLALIRNRKRYGY